MPPEARTPPSLALLVGGGFFTIGTLFVVAAVLGVVINPHPVLILVLGVGLAVAGLGWVTLTRNAYSVAVRHDGISLKFVSGTDVFVAWDQVTGYRNLFLGRRELLDIDNPDPGQLQVTRVLVLLHYRVGAKKRFAVLGLPGIGPLLGPVKQYRTALDEQGPPRRP